MIAASIFAVHIIAAVYAFLKYKKEGMSEGLLAVGFMVIIFSVGWTIATIVTNLLFTPEFFVKWYYAPTQSFFLQRLRKEINRDTISLILLTAGEWFFYFYYLRSDRNEPQESGKE